MWVDASPTRQSYLRFRLSGIDGRAVASARLSLEQLDASASGGRVRAMSSTSWSESATWDTRPAVDGDVLASFGGVSAGVDYEVELGPDAVQDGVVSLAIESTSGDGARWATRESSDPPRLTVQLESPPGTILDGLSEVAGMGVGSSEPTYYSGNRRAAVTAGGRMLVVHGRHQSGLQLAWRDAAGTWQTRSTGAASDGTLLSGTGTGDWPASIAIARDRYGAEHAWVVWSGPSRSSLRPVQMRRLTDLDSPDGPRLGPTVTIDAPAGGAYRADIAFERAPDGQMRGCVVWSRRTSADGTNHELLLTWFTDLATDAPAFHDRAVLLSSSSSSRFGSLVPGPTGMSLVARGSSDLLTLFGHDAAAALSGWSKRATGPVIHAQPAAVALASGDVLVAVERDTTSQLSGIYRFRAGAQTATTELELSGYAQPTLAGDGAGAWLVAVRGSDGTLISRQLGAQTGWTAADRVEVGREAGFPLAWPNAVRDTDGRLRLVAEGPGATSSTSSVISFQRPL